MKLFKTICFYLTIFAFLAICLGNQISKPLKGSTSKEDSFFEKLDLFVTVLTIIQNSYYREVSSKDLIYGALKGTLANLDPHSQFLEPRLYEEIQIDTEGHFGGLGVEVTIQDENIAIIAALPGTPAEKAGLKNDDRIVQIDGILVDSNDPNTSIRKLRGPIDSKIVLTIYRPNLNKYFNVELVRQRIQIKSIRTNVILPKTSIGYIKLSHFQEGSAKEFMEAKSLLEKNEMTALILDLRNNPGGLLEEAIELAGYIVGAEKLIVYTEGRIPEQNVKKFSKEDQKEINYPLIILINEGSASGSEIVSGAIQDYQKGKVLGTTSFGKASVQSLIPLNEGAGIRLTTALYFTPNGRLIHEKGIQPDIEKKLTQEDYIGHQKYKEEEHSKYDTFYPPFMDSQIMKAIEILQELISKE